MAKTRARRGPAATRHRSKGSRGAGVAVAAVVVVVVVLALVFLVQPPAPALDSRAIPNINTALTQVPDHDVAGADLAGVPRPRGSTRSYFVDKGPVVTVIYAEHTGVALVRRELETTLAAGGWHSLAAPASPHPVSDAIWQAVFVKAGRTLQVEAFRTEDVTGVTYILQNPHS